MIDVLSSVRYIPNIAKYITPLGSGDNSGSSWSNACPGFTGLCSPNSLTRGGTYFVADGDYTGNGNIIFSTSISGTIIITIQKATILYHGSDVGWLNSMGDGQAIFRAITFTTGYWFFNGVIRNEFNWRDVDSYGFRANNSTLDVSHNDLGAINIGSGNCVDSVIVQYTDIVGSGTLGESDDGVRIVSGIGCRSSNISIIRNAIHDGGEADSITARGVNGLIVEYNWMARNSPITGHTQGGDIMSTSNMHWRFNILEDIAGTAYFATPDQLSGLTPSSDYYIYGNIFMRSVNSSWPCCAYVIGLINTSTAHTGAFYVYNNTIVRMNNGNCFNNEGATLLVHIDAKISGAVIRAYNNLTWNSLGFNAQAMGGSANYSHNAYFNMTTPMTDSDPNAEFETFDPFISSISNNYHLLASTNQGEILTSPFNTDMLGNIRGINGLWDRGALEYIN